MAPLENSFWMEPNVPPVAVAAGQSTALALTLSASAHTERWEVSVNFLTVEEAARHMGVSIATVRRHAHSGVIAAQKSGRQWLINADTLPHRPAVRSSSAAPATFDVRTALRYVRSKDLTELWVPDVLRYEDYLDAEDTLLGRAAGRFAGESPDPALALAVDKTPFSTRPAVLLTLEDRIAYQAVVGAIAGKIDSALPPQVGSARLTDHAKFFLERGQTAWSSWNERVVAEVHGGKSWMIKADISSYFEHISHRLLLEEVSALNPPPHVHESLRGMLRVWAQVSDLGLPQGPNASRVLGNLYLLPVDVAMLGAGFTYYRYMDDFRIAGQSKAEVIRGMRRLEQECYQRGLTLSSAKTKLLHGDEAVDDGRNVALDVAGYLFELGDVANSKAALRKILRGALGSDGHIQVKPVKFSLWRLARLRDSTPLLNRVLPRLEDLAPVASVVAAYLAHFVDNRRVVDALADFMEDQDRASRSPYLVTHLFAVMLERPGPETLPTRWTQAAGQAVKDRNQPSYLRAVAAVVFARSRRPVDLTWLKQEVAREFDPRLLRSYAVALHRVGALDRVTEQVLMRKSDVLAQTVRYLQGRQVLPSLTYTGRTVAIR